jgi:chemotaxis protein histidine kinase CheA
VSRREATKNALRAKFLSIGLERLGNLSSAFVELEARPDDEAVLAAIMREIHTLKGEAKLVGFGSVADVAHTTEDLLLFANELALDARAPAHPRDHAGARPDDRYPVATSRR